MKSFFKMICIFVLLITIMFPSALAAEPGFADVGPDEWYSEAIAYVAESGLMNGIGGGEFAPDAPVSRAMAATVLWRLSGTPEHTYTSWIYPDVMENDWYCTAAMWAYPNVMDGFPIDYDEPTGFYGLFEPNMTLSREQLATVLYRYAKLQGIDVSNEGDLLAFSDHSEVSNWAYEAMQWCVANGLIYGISGENALLLAPGENALFLAPKEGTTRAQLACVMMRFCEKFL